MSINQTEHLGLHRWEGGDPFLRTEFNENFSALDGAVWAKSEIVTGSYTGDNKKDRTISLGFMPKAVLVVESRGITSYYYSDYGHCYGGLALPGKPVTMGNTVGVEIVNGGFCVSYQTVGEYTTIQSNQSGRTYYYLALK